MTTRLRKEVECMRQAVEKEMKKKKGFEDQLKQYVIIEEDQKRREELQEKSNKKAFTRIATIFVTRDEDRKEKDGLGLSVHTDPVLELGSEIVSTEGIIGNMFVRLVQHVGEDMESRLKGSNRLN